MYYLSISTQDHNICSTMENPLVFYEREEEGIPLFVKFFGGLLGQHHQEDRDHFVMFKDRLYRTHLVVPRL